MRPNAAMENSGIIRSSILREFCNLQRSEKGFNENGFKIDTWTTYARTKCAISQETMFAQTIKDHNSSKVSDIYFKIRYRSDVAASDRIEFRNKFYKIFSLADKTGTKEFLELRCQEIWD